MSGRRLSCRSFFPTNCCSENPLGCWNSTEDVYLFEVGRKKSSSCSESWFTWVFEVKENSIGKSQSICYKLAELKGTLLIINSLTSQRRWKSR